MIVKNYKADGYVAAPPGTLVAALAFGPDTGLVQERAEKLAKSVVADLSDPFNVADFTESALLADPARLADEVAAISMMGGRRVVRVRGATNASAEIFESLLADVKGDALVVVEAGDLAKSAPLRKLFSDADHAAAIECYPDSARDLPDVVRAALRAEGFSIAPGALEEAVSRLGADRGVTRRELEKLALYAKGQDRISLEDVRAVMGDEAGVRTDNAIDAAAAGDFARLDRELERLWASGTDAAQVIRTGLGHFQNLLDGRARTDRGEDIDAVLRRLRIPAKSPREGVFKTQLRRWRPGPLAEALDMLLEAEALTRTTGVPAEAVTGRALMNIAALVKAG